MLQLTGICLLLIVSSYTAYPQETSVEQYIKKLETARTIEDTIDQYYNIGYWYSFAGNDMEGDKYTYKAIELSKQHGLHTDEAKGYYLAAEKFTFLSNNDSAGYYADRCMRTYDKAGKRQGYYVSALNILASIALENADAEVAMELAQRQLEIATDQRDTSGLAKTYTLLSAIYESINNLEKAIVYSHKALELDRASGEIYNRAQALCNLAMLYMDKNDTKNAYPLLYEALHVATTEFPSDRDKSIALMYLGQCHHAAHEDDSAYYYFDATRQVIAGLDDPEITLRFCESFADLCQMTGRYDTALAYIDKSIAISGEYTVLDHYALGMKMRSAILAALGRYREAYEQYLAYTSLQDSLSGAEVQKTIAELKEKYESEKKDEHITRQRRDNRLLAGGSLIVLALAALISVQYIRQKNANATIQRQSDKLTLLMKELHHRVKNNLQIISSLLSLQSFRIKDEKASRAVREGQQRIEAMSLIHQRLYTRDNITEVNIREYISDLVDSLQSAYGFDRKDINIRLDIADELMNVDKAIPLSLIVNELVTNAFKYAYEDNSHPELTIRLKNDHDKIELLVADNGKGVNIEEWHDREGSFGKELVQTFVKQLNGYLHIVVDGGTRFTLTIPYAT